MQEDMNHSAAFIIFSFNRKLKDMLGMSLPIEEQLFLSHMFQHYMSRRKVRMLDYSIIENVEGFTALAEKLGQIAGTDLEKNQAFLDLINCQLRFFGEQEEKKDYLYYEDEKLFLEVKTRFKSLYEQVVAHYRWFDRQSPLYQIESESNIIETVLFLASIQNNLDVKKILLFTNKGPIWTHFLVDVLRAKFGRRMEIQTLDYLDELYAIDLRTIDFVISDTEIEKLTKPLVVITPLPSIRDFNTIEEMLINSHAKGSPHFHLIQNLDQNL